MPYILLQSSMIVVTTNTATSIELFHFSTTTATSSGVYSPAETDPNPSKDSHSSSSSSRSPSQLTKTFLCQTTSPSPSTKMPSAPFNSRRPRRIFNPHRSRRYGRPTFSPSVLVRWSPKWKFRRLFNFPFVGSHFRPRMHTLVVSIDGGCRVNDRSRAHESRAASAVYFGPGSKDNAARELTVGRDGAKTSNRAELHAAIMALEILRRKLEEEQDEEEEERSGASNGTLASMLWEVIIMTDSTYVAASMSSWVWKWERNGWRTADGKPVENQDLIRRLHALITTFESGLEINVRFWRVAREDNVEADGMVNAVLDGEV